LLFGKNKQTNKQTNKTEKPKTETKTAKLKSMGADHHTLLAYGARRWWIKPGG